MRGEIARGWSWALGLAALGAVALGCNRIDLTLRPSPRGPNVLLVTIDTLRADYVGAYGRAQAETPTLDALAAEGVLFEQAMATAPITLPSHTSILTGLYPPRHGVRHNAVHVLREELRTIAEVFHDAGYATGAFVAAEVLSKDFGLSQGFDEYDDQMGAERSSSSGFAERKATAVSDVAIDWLSRTDRPFFAWVHYYDVHSDYAPPEPYRTRHAGNPYDGEVAYVDAQLARVLEALKRSGRYEQTLIAVTADHGEGLGQHGEGSHTFLIYDSVMHVPMILRGPGLPRAKRVSAVASNAALAPTLAALAGLPAMEGLDVADLAPLWHGGSEAPGWVYMESIAGQLDFGWAPLFGIRTQTEKYIRAPKRELYDVAHDPRELTNLLPGAEVPAASVAFAEARIDSVRATEREAARAELDPETRAAIEALGYVIPSERPAGPAFAGADPKDVHALANVVPYALAAHWEGNYDLAIRYALEGLKMMPDSERLEGILVQSYLASERPADALEHARAIVHLSPRSADALAQLGVVYLYLQDFAHAVPAFEAALRLEPDHPSAHLGAMWGPKLGGGIEQAEQHAARALALEAEHFSTWDSVGETWETLGDYERALTTYEAALERFPDEPRAEMRLAIQYARLGDDTRAAAHLAKAGESARDPRLANRLGIVYAARGDSARAERLFRAVAERSPESGARAYLARLLRETGRAAEAQQLLEQGAPMLAPKPMLDGLSRGAIPRG